MNDMEIFVAEIHEEDVVDCAMCGKVLLFSDSYSPGDEAICAECDTEITGSQRSGEAQSHPAPGVRDSSPRSINSCSDARALPSLQARSPRPSTAPSSSGRYPCFFPGCIMPG